MPRRAGECRRAREAVEAVHKERPGLILADIQLADGSSGLDAVNELLKTFEVPVVFITGLLHRKPLCERQAFVTALDVGLNMPRAYMATITTAIMSMDQP